MSERDVHFHRAALVPETWRVDCPVCGAGVEVPEVSDDDAGVFHPLNEHCVVECGCGSFIEPYGAHVQECRDMPYDAARALQERQP